MMHQLQDPTHVVPSIIVGLLLSCGWDVAYNLDQEPYIQHPKHLTTYSTWWECLEAVVKFSSHPSE